MESWEDCFLASVIVQQAAHTPAGDLVSEEDLEKLSLDNLKDVFKGVAMPTLRHILHQRGESSDKCFSCSSQQERTSYFESFLDFLISFQSAFLSMEERIPRKFG